MNKLLLYLILIIVLFLSSCFKSENKDNEKNFDFSRIEEISEEQKTKIASSVLHDAKISNMKTIKSNDFDNVYFVSGIITDTSNNQAIGIWATGGKDGVSLVMSANGIAKEYTPFPYGKDTKSGITFLDDGGEILLNSYESIKK